MTEKVTPNCRYGHGDLVPITQEDGGRKQKFAVANPDDVNQVFVGNVYACIKCGYTEFFDDEPQVTARHGGKMQGMLP